MNGLRQKMLSGEVVLGTMLSELACPNLIRIMQTAGFDFVIADCEHGYFDYSQIGALAAVGAGFGMPLLVRIPKIDREYVQKVLDMGCTGLLVPMVSTPEDARAIVEFAKYAPLGKRGLSTTRAHTNYNPPPLSEYLPAANERTIIMAQIETRLAVENIPAIAATPGIDVVMIGPNDLASDFGHPGKLDTDDMFAVAEKIVAASKENGKGCGIIESKVPFLHKLRDKGMNVFSCGSELGMVMKAARTTVNDFRAN